MSPCGKRPRQPSWLSYVLDLEPMLRRVLHGAGVPAADVDDLVQEVTLRAWLAVKDGRLNVEHRSPVYAWLRLVAERIGIRWAIRAKRTITLDRDVADRDDDAEEPYIARDMLEELCRSTTPERWRAWLLRAQGATDDEIAAEEQMPEGTVHSRVRRAREDFQDALSREIARERNPVPRSRLRRRRS